MTMAEARVPAPESIAGRYRPLQVVHRETNRVCWFGEDVGAGRPCLLTWTGLPAGGGDDAEGARRLTGRVLRMAETMGRLCPGRVPAVLDAVVQDGGLWTVTDWIDGTPLGELLAVQGPFNYVRAARIGLEVLDVLQAAHGEGVTHGELSPGQVFVPDRGPVLVTGFGLAGATLAPRLAAPSYASPEQARDERIGPAADLWALGAMLYTMVEGRPPFRDRGRFEATLRGVDRLPLRTPVRAGPLARTVQGLLRKDSRERLTRPVVREALTRVVHEDPDAALPAPPAPRLRRAYAAAAHAGADGRGRLLAFGTALAVVTVTVAVLAVTHGSGGGTATGARTAPPSGLPTTAPPARRPSPSPSSSSSPTALPSGFRTYTAPEGFSVALPETWRRQRTTRVSDLAYRVVFGADGDPRTLAVTYSERVGPDPVAVWREDVEPQLERTGGYRRIGPISATTYQGRRAADMQWLATADGDRLRTFGRGFLVGGGRGYSLRFTTPAADWSDAANRRALEVFLRTFRPASD
ncbi:protein kinase domain-containing protein [Streptomyces griseosporeus]|uniref:protein kinase domain-containing protein n=1 Tax=Streptomyces griseosporeus TaxID=1910 RepID=UPI00167F0C18|nr:serine/threonine-protein kinase [Streptomyces griseosporeus]